MIANNWSLVEIGATGKFSTERMTKRDIAEKIQNSPLTAFSLLPTICFATKAAILVLADQRPWKTERPAIGIIHCETLFIGKGKRITIHNIVISIL